MPSKGDAAMAEWKYGKFSEWRTDEVVGGLNARIETEV